MDTCAMTGIEVSIGIVGFQSLSQGLYFFVCLLSVEQVEPTDNGMNGPGTGRKNVLQSAMSATRK